MKILLAADGSAFTRAAARHLVSHLQWFAKPPEIHILHVHAAMPFRSAAAQVGKEAVEKYQREESEAALAVAETELKAAGIAYKSTWVVGKIAAQIAKHVQEHAIDLVVMGTHGQGALANLALGSVAATCFAVVDVPIMVVSVRQRTDAPKPRG